MSKKPATDKKAKSGGAPKTKERPGPNGKKRASKRKTSGRVIPHAKEAMAAPGPRTPEPDPLVDREQDTAVQFEPVAIAPYDDTLLDVCRTRWQLADWEALARVDGQTLLNHPHRAKIALLVAAALFQLGRNQEAQRLLQSALDWGASPRQVVQMLMSGVHHGLAEAHGLLGRAENARAHHLDALRTGGVPGDAELLARVRLMKNPLTE